MIIKVYKVYQQFTFGGQWKMEHYYSMSRKELDWHFSPSKFAVTETSTAVDRTISVLNESKRNKTINGIYIYTLFFGRMPMHHMQSH